MSIEEDILIERFLKKQLTNSEKDNVLKRIETNQSFKEKVNFERNLLDSFNEDNWSFAENIDSTLVKEYEHIYISKETKSIKTAISKANLAYKKKQQSPFKRWYLYSSAAAVIILFFSIYFFDFYRLTPQEIYKNQINNVEFISFAQRGDSHNIKELIEGQKYFENKKFKEALSIFSKELEKNNSESNLYLYTAVSQIELDKFSNAEKTLNQLIKSDLIDAEKGYWFKALMYIKSNQLTEAKTTLKFIINNSYFNSIPAKELLDKLKDL